MSFFNTVLPDTFAIFWWSQGTPAVQVFSGNLLDEMATAYLLSVENFEQVAQPIISVVEHPAHADSSVAADTIGSGSSSGSYLFQSWF